MLKHREGKKAQRENSSNGPKLGHLYSNWNGKAKKVVSSPIGRPAGIIVPSKIGRQASTHTAKTLSCELSPFYQELCHEIRAQMIADRIKKLVLQHSEKKRKKATKIPGKIVPSDEMSFVSGLTMGSSILEMKSTAIHRAKPPPPTPKKKESLLQTAKACPPPPPRRIPSSKNPPRPSVMSNSYLPPQLEVIAKAKAPAPPTQTLVDSSLVSLSVSDLCPDTLSHRQECDIGVTRSPTSPGTKTLRKSLQKSPPPPPRTKVIAMPSLPSSLFSLCQDEITCSGREGYVATEQDSSGAPSSSGTKSPIQRRRICGSGQTKVVLGNTIRIKPGACRENDRVCNPSPLPGRGKEPLPSRSLRQNQNRKDGGRDKISLPPVSFRRNSISDRARKKCKKPFNNFKDVTCRSTMTLQLHDKKNVQGNFANSRSISTSKSKEITRTKHDEKGTCPDPSGRFSGTAADGKRIVAGNMMPSSSRKAKFDKYGRCLQHPSGVMSKKNTSDEEYILVRDECRQCVQECSHDSSNWGEDCIRAAGNKVEVAKSKPGSKITPTNNCAHNLTDVDERDPRIRSIFGENHSSSQTQVVKSSDSRDKTSRVSTMPYSALWGRSGWYSGDVNEDGIPHGIGMMRFKNGDKCDGKWTTGYPDMFLANGYRTKRVYSKNRTPREEAHTKRPSFRHPKPADSHRVKAHSEFHRYKTSKP
mmetsp:Transcript_16358/g.35411  ORF Transcript_16358/g.35411 Transcript_16358/m.35411 type:complete len:699 (+) Transcript_16358:98-2194(+)